MAEEVKNNDTPAQAEVKTEATAAPASGPVPTPGVEEAPAAPDLNISDLNAVKSIIDIATTRGAFKANELEAVGKTYNKLTMFLEHVSKQQNEQQAQGK